MNKENQIAYADRSDIEKIVSQWKKLHGLLDREDWSAAVVRAATAVEITLNFAIRHEFRQQSSLKKPFVDALLKWANGLTGKLEKLLLPILEGQPKHAAIVKLKSHATAINSRRNKIVHQGLFDNENPAKALINDCKLFVEGVVRQYQPEFILQVYLYETRNAQHDPEVPTPTSTSGNV